MASKRRVLIFSIVSSLVFALLHHFLFHALIQPFLNTFPFFGTLPGFLLGSTSVITLWVFLYNILENMFLERVVRRKG